MKALILGATGYTGSLLLSLLCRHPKIQSISAHSHSIQGAKIADRVVLGHSEKLQNPHYLDIQEIQARDYDVIFSALPHGVSSKMYYDLSKHAHSNTATSSSTSTHVSARTHRQSNTSPFVYIDLSADFRFSTIKSYLQAYKDSFVVEDTFFSKTYSRAVYGLSELQRNEIVDSNVIACPGCYPTSILLALIPILKYSTPRDIITISSISGISGAGRAPQEKSQYCSRVESLIPYSIGRSHRHYFEIKDKIEQLAHSEARFSFSPQLAPLAQGMLSCIHIPLSNSDMGRAKDALRSQYIDENFIYLTEDLSEIDTKLVRNTNSVHIACHEEDELLIVMSAIDNLWKGASSQAIQNFNIRFGFDEKEGLDYFAR